MKMTLIIFLFSIISMITLIIVKPSIKIGKITIQTHWIATLFGAILLILFKKVSFNEISNSFFNEDSINPLKILILFFSMSFLSIILDDLGFFNYLAIKVTNKAKNNQKSLFTILYFSISILTVFTSNDIVILTFTPFIALLTKRMKINPIPYLVSEFIAANTLSMSLIIGNPTNIYLALSYDVDFISYLKIMMPISIIICIITYFILLITFRKDLTKDITLEKEIECIDNKPLVIIELSILIVCTVLMAVSNFISLPMYLISLICAILALFILVIYKLLVNKNLSLLSPIKKLPYDLIPFLLSMFIIVIAINNQGISAKIKELIFDNNINLPLYGLTSLVTANVMNNIPMSILYSLLLDGSEYSLYQTIISSNLAAIITPLGSLAGIMFLSILKKNEINFNFIDFIKYGFVGIIEALLSFALLSIII